MPAPAEETLAKCPVNPFLLQESCLKPVLAPGTGSQTGRLTSRHIQIIGQEKEPTT